MKFITHIFFAFSIVTFVSVSEHVQVQESVLEVSSSYYEHEKSKTSNFNEDINCAKIVYNFSSYLDNLNTNNIKYYNEYVSQPSLRPPIA